MLGTLKNNRPLGLLTAAMLILLTIAGAGLLLDPRLVTGQPVWLKPAKFALSIAVYSATLAWLLAFVKGHRRFVLVASALTALGLGTEIAIIAGQAARGVASHFNNTTPLDAALFGIMGFFIVVVWLMSLIVAVLLVRQGLPDPALAAGMRLGVGLTVLGAFLALPMLVLQAHTVGAPDGGPGLPLIGWSTTGGDLRVAHFLGLHALQVLPLAGWWLWRRAPAGLGDGHRVGLVAVAAYAYAGLELILFWQALRAQPLTAPDAATLGALAALALTSVLAVTGIVIQAALRRSRQSAAALTQRALTS